MSLRMRERMREQADMQNHIERTMYFTRRPMRSRYDSLKIFDSFTALREDLFTAAPATFSNLGKFESEQQFDWHMHQKRGNSRERGEEVDNKPALDVVHHDLLRVGHLQDAARRSAAPSQRMCQNLRYVHHG